MVFNRGCGDVQLFRDLRVAEAQRQKAHSEEKRRIGAMAATLINDGEIIILDSGTTTVEIARHIKKKKGQQIITNGLNIAAELLDARGVQIFIVGGVSPSKHAGLVERPIFNRQCGPLRLLSSVHGSTTQRP